MAAQVSGSVLVRVWARVVHGWFAPESGAVPRRDQREIVGRYIQGIDGDDVPLAWVVTEI